MNAANSFSQLIIAKQMQQALEKNPDDVGALVTLASLIRNDPDLKRKVLDRILELEPANKRAREMLLELDRAEISGGQGLTVSAVPIVGTPVTEAGRPVKDALEKPLVSRYSILHQILVYPVVAFTLLLMFLAIDEWNVFLFFGFVFLLLLIPVWFVSAIVEVNSTGIKISRLFGLYQRELEWGEINSIKPNPMGVGMRLTSKEGTSLKISSQMHRYAAIVEILQRMRPDLFKIGSMKIFRKGFFGKYGWLFILIPATLLTPGAVVAPPFIPGIIIAVIVYFFWKAILHAPHTVMIEGDSLYAKSFRSRLEVTAQQIRDIKIVTVHNRRGVARNLIQIDFVEDELSFTGFPEGNEVMYGLLKNWWNEHRIT